MTERRTVLHCADGVRRTLITDTLDPNSFTIQTEQVMDEILAGIARDREIDQTGRVNKRTHSLPTYVYDDLVRRGIADDPDAFKSWLNSSEADDFRIWPGRL